MAKQYYAIQQVERTAELYIFGDIVPFELFDGDVSAHGIVKQIKDLDVDIINVHIDSYGGAVSEGWAIYNALKSHPAKVNTYGDGFVASAALYPFMAGDNRYASNLSAYYFHQVMISASGYAKDLRAAADEAEMMTEIGINAFTDNTGMSADEVRELQKMESWLTPTEALERGIATAILADSATRYTQGAKRRAIQSVFRDITKLEKQEETPPETYDTKPNNSPPNLIQVLAGRFIPKNKEENK